MKQILAFIASLSFAVSVGILTGNVITLMLVYVGCLVTFWYFDLLLSNTK